MIGLIIGFIGLIDWFASPDRLVGFIGFKVRFACTFVHESRDKMLLVLILAGMLHLLLRGSFLIRFGDCGTSLFSFNTLFVGVDNALPHSRTSCMSSSVVVVVIDAGRICVGFDFVLDFFFGVAGMLYSARNDLYPSSRGLTYNTN